MHLFSGVADVHSIRSDVKGNVEVMFQTSVNFDGRLVIERTKGIVNLILCNSQNETTALLSMKMLINQSNIQLFIGDSFSRSMESIPCDHFTSKRTSRSISVASGKASFLYANAVESTFPRNGNRDSRTIFLSLKETIQQKIHQLIFFRISLSISASRLYGKLHRGVLSVRRDVDERMSTSSISSSIHSSYRT